MIFFWIKWPNSILIPKIIGGILIYEGLGLYRMQDMALDLNVLCAMLLELKILGRQSHSLAIQEMQNFKNNVLREKENSGSKKSLSNKTHNFKYLIVLCI